MTDMTTSDLKAAAERLRRHRDAKICGDSPYYDAGLNLLRWYQIDQDTKITSLAYLATQQQGRGDATKTDGPTIQNVRDELRSALNMMLLMATANQITGKLDRVNWIHDTVRNMAAFGANCKLISMGECGDWCRAMAGTISVADVLQKWDEPFREITARKEQPAPDAAITEEWLRDVSHSCGKSGCEWRFTNEETTLSVDRWHADDSWRVFAVTETLSVWLASYKYEHQLLSLLAALGVPVKKDAEVRHG